MSEVKACKQEGCPVRVDGKCLEGLDLDKHECPHFYWETEEVALTSVQKEVSAIPAPSSTRTNLFTGNELSLNEITLVTHKYACDLIVILGDLDCGKTTLLGTIYDLFQVGRFQSYLFAGSLTQKGFEVRSFLSRVDSGRTNPETERTKALDFKLLHIGIKEDGEGSIKHLLLSDVSGETIRQTRSSSSLMKSQLEIVKHAKHIFYVIDGEKLAFSHRIKTMLNAELFIQNAISNSIFTSSTVLNILISKWDKIKNETGFNFESMVVNKLNNRFAPQLAEIHYLKIASRPDIENEEFNLGYGLEELLKYFMKPTERQEKNVQSVIISDRFFDKLQMKRNG